MEESLGEDIVRRQSSTSQEERPHQKLNQPVCDLRLSRLQNSEKNNFCCLKPPKQWYFIMVVELTNTRYLLTPLDVSFDNVEDTLALLPRIETRK